MPSRPHHWKFRLLLLAVVFLLAGCATHGPAPQLPVYTDHGPAVEVPEVDVMAMTPEMQAFLDRYVLPYNSLDTRLDLLTRAILDSALLGFHYTDARTYTAAEAFETRSGNCVGFANLMVALARASGLDAAYQEVFIEPEWTSDNDTLMVARHINVVISSPTVSVIADTSGMAIRSQDRKVRISDDHALGLYWNNLGVDALLAGDNARAWAYLHHATEVAPSLPDAWINLGVVYARNRQYQGAVMAYQRALDIDGNEPVALSNLYAVYEVHEHEVGMAELAPAVERYRQRNPYHLMKQAELAVEEDRAVEATDLLKRAIAIKPVEPRFHLELARVWVVLGEPGAATESLEQARSLAKAQGLDGYDLDLASLWED